MASISYLYLSAPHLEHLQECYKSIEYLITKLENNPPHATSNKIRCDLEAANHLIDLQARINKSCQEKYILPKLIPKLLILWNMQRVKLGKEKEIGLFDEPKGLGMLGGIATGKVRLKARESRSQAKLSKANKNCLAALHSSATSSGRSALNSNTSSLVFTPCEGPN
ncbi:hypothetical protein PCANC_27771 [Puccinia coronata f. sp. avenae]|uniref:Prp31 C-terminal domain-containing protein n=1 Tax=Puccinia coronata f. sp. avenae TaxID=200324 RepID=A0A2N5TNG1_9BASI|nr:hypothetical protein PCANC_27771 [Puccinia coronata f. sp. avenae]